MIRLQAKSIVLRALEPEDLDLLMQWENDPSLWHLSGTIAPYSRYQLKQYVAEGQANIYQAGQLRLMVENRADQQAVGTIDLFDFDAHNRRAGVGILIAKAENRQKGYAKAALDLLIPYAFETLDLHQLYCNILVDNQASIQLFEQAGFVQCGLKKDWIRRYGTYQDELLFQRLRRS